MIGSQETCILLSVSVVDEFIEIVSDYFPVNTFINSNNLKKFWTYKIIEVKKTITINLTLDDAF